MNGWHPSASLPMLRRRAELLRQIRRFFEERGVFEVDTPLLSAHATVDPHIDSFYADHPFDGSRRYLHTSPEFAMKRLLAAGSGDLFQLCHVFRAGEQGRHHNSEFMLLEWYRVGWSYTELLAEIGALLQSILNPNSPLQLIPYRQLFQQQLGVDPLQCEPAELQRVALDHRPDLAAGLTLDREGWLEWLFSFLLQPQLGHTGAVAVIDYPAHQAALARLKPDDPQVAERFEIFYRGIELGNGFGELTDATEQQQRFEAEQQQRQQRGQTVPPFDRHLIAALHAGLPPCSGVALGFDRLLMAQTGAASIQEVIPFHFEQS